MPPYQDAMPPEYQAWLTRNIENHDPIFRSFRLKDSFMGPFLSSPASFKCADERCIHYIYGFHNQDDRDKHVQDHNIPFKRDSGLSLGNTPSTAFPDSASTRGNFSLDFTPKHPSSSPLYLPKPSNALPLPSLTVPSQSKDRKDSLFGYSFTRDFAGPSPQSTEPEVDPQLPPIKKARVGPSRLESIEELRLSHETGSCLRCKVKGLSVGLDTPALFQWCISNILPV